MDGILNINKPVDMTSFSVVALIKRLTHEQKVGHAGTLDPRASGVLPVCLGLATRVMEFLFAETKAYRAEVELGISTDTCDSSGKILHSLDASGISRGIVEATLPKFRGAIQQIPPMYSALKYKGKPLYKLARSGIEVQRKSRTVHIDLLEIVDWQPSLATLHIVCGKGTYIRSLAQDLGEVLGCGANLKSLIRLRVGPFCIEEALTLPQLEEAVRLGELAKCLYPVDRVLSDFPAITVNQEQMKALIHGASISPFADAERELPALADGTLRRAYTGDGSFVAIIKYDAASLQWRPQKVFLKEL